MKRTEIFEELLEPLNKMGKETNEIPADEIMKSYNHIYMTMIASSLCNISDKMDEMLDGHLDFYNLIKDCPDVPANCIDIHTHREVINAIAHEIDNADSPYGWEGYLKKKDVIYIINSYLPDAYKYVMEDEETTNE